MKKALAWLLVLLMAFSVMGCSAPAPVATEPTAEPAAEAPAATDAQPAAAATEAPDYSKIRVVALLPGTITDNGWNYICYDAVKQIGEKYKCTA